MLVFLMMSFLIVVSKSGVVVIIKEVIRSVGLIVERFIRWFFL